MHVLITHVLTSVQMERTVELEDNMKVLRELERLSQCSSSEFSLAFGVRIGKQIAGVRSPLELIGLYIKEEYMNDKEEGEEQVLNGDTEEGEIIL